LSDDVPYRILYAPTHKDDAYSTTLFPFSDFDLDRLREFPRDRGIELYARIHFSEDDQAFYDRIVDDETIFRAGQSFWPSPIEIFTSFDMLVTDYSSIYVDYLPVDGLMVFVKDDHDTFQSKRGFAFDYEEYFPGRKVESFEVFRSHLARCVEERTDGHEEDRTFVRRTFLPEREDVP
jgi:CDP-glycerol glycerophosphotransferase